MQALDSLQASSWRSSQEAPTRPTGLLVAIQLLAFVIAGLVAGRLSLVGAAPAGGFAALLLYFGLAVVSIAAGNDRHPVAFLLFGIFALAFGTAGGTSPTDSDGRDMFATALRDYRCSVRAGGTIAVTHGRGKSGLRRA